MKTLIRIAVGGILAGLLAACGPAYHYPAPTTPPSQPAPPPDPRPQPQPETEREPPRTIRPAEEADAPTQRNSAVDGLLEQGWTQYRNRNYEGVLSIAERAQRIDGRNPEVYLLMARAKLALYQNAAAEQLARRGLSLSRAGTSVYRDLQALLAQISR